MRAKLFVEAPTGEEQGAQVTNASATKDLIPSIGAAAAAS
jgi:hypothetical protein